MEQEKVFFGTPIRIKSTAPLFPGSRATVAYVGTEGVSVYLLSDVFDDCVSLKWDEFDIDRDPR